MNASLGSRHAPGAARARGQAMLLTVLLLGVGASALVYALATPSKQAVQSDKVTAVALARARDALIGHAASHQLQPGVLPCPDNDNDGSADAPCGALGVTAIGRLPWRTLGIEPLRDGAGECLWYAVSANFKNSGVSGPAVVNSDSAGTLVVNDSAGTAVLSGANAALAIVFAPGPGLPSQDRTPGAASVCGGNNNAANYLDTYTVGAANYNNATGGGTNNFVMPPAAAQYGQINDRLMPITSEALFSVVNVRVAKEAVAAMEAYRTAYTYYPFANAYGSAAPYNCSVNLVRGRFPITITGCGQPDWPANALPAWFGTNNWNLVTHYAISKSCGQILPLGLPLGLDTVIASAIASVCGLASSIPALNTLIAAVNVILNSLSLPPISFTDEPLQVTGVTGPNGARLLVIVTGRALNAQVHACASDDQCMEDAENTDTEATAASPGSYTYVRPSRFPASNDRMAVVCDNANRCPIVP